MTAEIGTRIPATAVDIQKWIPTKFSDFIGNRAIVRYFKGGVQLNGAIGNTLLTGLSRSGKTASVKLFIKACICSDRDAVTGDPCGRCNTCIDDVGTYDHRGHFSTLDDGAESRAVDLHYLPIDCPRITETDLRNELREMRDFDGLRIVYLDEIHRLVRRGMDEMLLKPMEERNFVWIASSATTRGLERMFLNRFPIKLRTASPTRDELAEFVAHRCVEWQIEWDGPATLVRLAERCNQVAGLALQVLAFAAATPQRCLTAEMVEDHQFEEDED